MKNTKTIKIINWTVRIIAAVILLQTLFFKLSGAEETIYIFTTMGMEPFGRYASSIVELIAAVLLLVPNTVWLGAGLSLGAMSGAIFSHLTKLGIVVLDDGGALFVMAILVSVCSAAALYLNRHQLPFLPFHQNAAD
jgi:uncharacterized membrane protein YphA (DoxX/SURF4 family)